MESFLLFSIIIGLAIVMIAVSVYLSNRRAQAIQTVAAQMGFDYCRRSRQLMHPSLQHSELCSRGRNRYLTNLISGQLDHLPVSIADYRYTTGSRKNRRTIQQTVVVIERQQSHLPQFILKPENIFHKIGGLIGFQDIDFDTHPDFSKNYSLKGHDETAIRDCFSSDVLTFFENHRQFWVESTGPALMVYIKGKAYQPRDWQRLLNTACRIYRQF